MNKFYHTFQITNDIRLNVINGDTDTKDTPTSTGANLSFEFVTTRRFPPFYSDTVKHNVILGELEGTKARAFFEKWDNKRYKRLYNDVANDLLRDIEDLKITYHHISIEQDKAPMIDGLVCGCVGELKPSVVNLYTLEAIEKGEAREIQDTTVLCGVFVNNEPIGFCKDVEDATRYANQIVREKLSLESVCDISLKIGFIDTATKTAKERSEVGDFLSVMKNGEVTNDFLDFCLTTLDDELIENKPKRGYER